jgi:hypothetical protein
MVLLSWLVIGIPLFVGLWFWFGSWVMVLLAGAVWGSSLHEARRHILVD